MKKILLASIIATSNLFAAPIVIPTPAVLDTAKVATADTAKIAIAPIADTTKTTVTPTDTAKVVATPAVVDSAVTTPTIISDTVKAAPVETPEPIVKASVKESPAEVNVMAAPGSEKADVSSNKEPKTAARAPLFVRNDFSLDINASFEIQAGKTLWTSEDDEDGNNLEEWWGRANLGLATESKDFSGRMLMHIYTGDLEGNEVYVRKDGDTSFEYRDLFEIHEAWALQRTKYMNFKLGRWEFTQKNGDFFGDYVDGYYKGFKSGLSSENAIEFQLAPNENMSMELAFISKAPHLNEGDLRLMFHFRKLASIEALDLDLGYRNNIFNEIYASDDNDVRHTISLQGKTPLVPGIVYLFLEAALMNLDAETDYTYVDPNTGIERTKTKTVDMVTPITGGLIFTPRDYRIILEAEFVNNRDATELADNNKHVKDVLGAFYIEKPLSKHFTLSFGAHSYESSKDFAFTGNLIGTIN